jgi:EAL domain-containing protein (putative c-di-GMP-specific phosphodiesterase class I)
MKYKLLTFSSRLRKFTVSINAIRMTALVTFMALFVDHRINVDQVPFFTLAPHEIEILEMGVILFFVILLIKKIAERGVAEVSQVITVEDIVVGVEQNQFELYLQPKVRLDDNKVTGAECLLRWNHPVHGLLYPDMFIPIVEKHGNGALEKLTYYTITKTAKLYSELYDAGHDLELSVNVSAKCFVYNKDIVNTIKEVTAAYRMPLQKLILEITETTGIENFNDASAILSELHNMGVKISVDDFGTGYSSHIYLKLFPVREIKINKEFTGGLYANENDRVIVASIIALAHDTGARVVAEGVETDVTCNILREMNCDYIQGYIILRAVQFQEFVDWLAITK